MTFRPKTCPKWRCEFQNTTKSVPHTCMSTEVRDTYIVPQLHSMDFNADVKHKIVFEAITPFSTKSEYAIYGSGSP
ncbi:GL17794 [Drosophila persimilis]|uniref:GL17794 n=1 Tax=Drosophila persimilis TaxID=7234 RepID=B4ISK1_DROPE|nr:GL17794 [Drosophila persimilis]